jgi:peptidoglycan L-alanyl-D-glutamate endopeptidase CwlK
VPTFGERSQRNLANVHGDLVLLFGEVVKDYDCAVLSGYRTEAEQTALLEHDPPRTTLPWPQSKHNRMPSLAVDVAPWPIDWSNITRFCHFAGYVDRVAWELGVEVEWGGWWRRFPDYGHFQLRGANE